MDRIEFTFWLDTSAHDIHNPANAPPPLIHDHVVGAGIIPFPKDMFSRKGIDNPPDTGLKICFKRSTMWCWLWGQIYAHSRIPDYRIEDQEKKFHFESLPEQPTR